MRGTQIGESSVPTMCLVRNIAANPFVLVAE